ncbi:MAG: VIT1/CCC1 transporter family protein [Candidatus Altiarchaeota archaeon]
MYLKISRVLDIAERFFVLNGFDGLYTMMGIIVGSYVAGHHDPNIVLASGFTGIVALGISGSASAYVSEKAMREKQIKKLERHMMKKMDKTVQKEASDFAAVFSALVNGFSPILTAMIMVIPFILARIGLLGVEYAFSYSMMIGAFEVIVVGFYLGKISGGSKIAYGMRMLFIAAVAVIISYYLGYMLS